jgi:uncharacterized protein (DUF58 family)
MNAPARTVVQLPRGAELRRIQLRSRKLVSADLLGQYRSAFRGSGLVYTDIREYQPGDDVKHIHWKATARTGTVFVKSYEEDRQLRVMLAVDASASMRAPLGAQCAIKALEVSALVAALTQRGNDLLGLSVFADRELAVLPPRSGARRSSQVLSVLMRDAGGTPPLRVGSGAATGGRTDLAGALYRLRTSLKKPSIVFVISDFFTPAFEEELQLIGVKHDLILVQIQPAVRALPEVGLVTFFDAESGDQIVVDAGNRRVRAAWVELLDTQRDQLAEVARRCGVDHITVRESAAEPLLALMRSRALRGRARR